jgi:hypothetical protein
MPDADGFPTADDIIHGREPKPQSVQVPMPTPDADQQKAIYLILSGMPFVLVAARPTRQENGKATPCAPADATGADFFTVVRGDSDTLLGVQAHLPDIVARAYTKQGLL